MARAVLLALAFAELASGARYVDYSGVKMSQYGGGADYEGPRDEYDDHSPDILSASHDYRDEDELIGKTEKLIKDFEETEVWQKFDTTGKYRRQSSSIDDGDIDTLDKYSPEEMVPKFKPSNRFAKHRSLKIRDFERGDVARRRPLKTQSRHRVDDLVRKDVFDELHSDNFRESKHSDLHEDSMEFTRRATTARVIRRKPRDRVEKTPSDDDDPLADLGLNLGDSGLMKSGRLDDYRLGNEFRRGGGPPRHPEGAPSFSDNDFSRSSGFQRRPLDRGDTFRDREESMEKPMGKHIQEYNDYYDMKRVQSIKNKLPGLMDASAEDIRTGKQYLTFRRAGGGVMMAPTPDPNLLKVIVPNTTTTDAPHSEISEKASPALKANISTAVTSSPSIIVTYKNAAPNLSLAQKSKLSILKSLKKESGINESTTKPPVLLHVTKNGHTVIMVEPPTAPNPLLLGARLVSNDSPGTQEKVKRLMRQKLLANSKNLRELTENWDSLICDYIDTSLLKEDHPDLLSNSNLNLCTLNVFILLFVHYIFETLKATL